MNKLILLFLGVACVASAEIVERVIAVVNTEPVLESDLKSLQVRARNADFLYPFLIPNNDPAILTHDRKEDLTYLIGEKIMESEIKRLGLEVTSEKVDSEIRAIAKRNNMTEDELFAQIKREGITQSKYQETMKENIERQSLLEQEIVSKIRVTDDDALTQYMNTHADARSSVNEFSVAHIFFDPKRAGGTDGAYARAEEALERLHKGENFESLAQQFSEDPNFTAGGVLGNFKTGEFLKEIEEAIAPLQVGQTTGIVRSRIGFHIVKLLSKNITPDPRFEKEKERIKSGLLEKAVHRQFGIWLQTKKDDAYIRINTPNP